MSRGKSSGAARTKAMKRIKKKNNEYGDYTTGNVRVTGKNAKKKSFDIDRADKATAKNRAEFEREMRGLPKKKAKKKTKTYKKKTLKRG